MAYLSLMYMVKNLIEDIKNLIPADILSKIIVAIQNILADDDMNLDVTIANTIVGIIGILIAFRPQKNPKTKSGRGKSFLLKTILLISASWIIILLLQHMWVLAFAAVAATVLFPFLFIISTKIFTRIFKHLKRWAENTGDTLAERIIIKFRDLTSGFQRKYYERLIYKYRTFKIQGLITRGPFTLDLEKVFVSLRVSPENKDRISAAMIQEIREADRHLDIWHFLANRKKYPVYRSLAVIAPPGAGKTTLLEHLALTYAQKAHHKHHPKTPKLVPDLDLDRYLDLDLDLDLARAGARDLVRDRDLVRISLISFSILNILLWQILNNAYKTISNNKELLKGSKKSRKQIGWCCRNGDIQIFYSCNISMMSIIMSPLLQHYHKSKHWLRKVPEKEMNLFSFMPLEYCWMNARKETCRHGRAYGLCGSGWGRKMITHTEKCFLRLSIISSFEALQNLGSLTDSLKYFALRSRPPRFPMFPKPRRS